MSGNLSLYAYALGRKSHEENPVEVGVVLARSLKDAQDFIQLRQHERGLSLIDVSREELVPVAEFDEAIKLTIKWARGKWPENCFRIFSEIKAFAVHHGEKGRYCAPFTLIEHQMNQAIQDFALNGRKTWQVRV